MNHSAAALRFGYIGLGICIFWLGHSLLWHHMDELTGSIFALIVVGLLTWMSEDFNS